MYQTKHAYETLGEKQIKDLFPKPDYSHINPLIVIGDPIKVSFDDITIDDETGNVARFDAGIDPAHVHALKTSFHAALLITEELPALSEKTHPAPKKYILKYGFGRVHALIELGLDGWFFNVIKKKKSEDSEELVDLSQSEWEDVSLYENEPVPKKHNKEQNIIDTAIKKIGRGDLDNTETCIFDHLKKIFPNRPKPSLNRIKEAVMEASNTKQKHTYYTESKIKLWMKDHSSEDYVFNGEYDEKRKMYGFSCKHGTLNRTFISALKKFAETGHKSYVVMHFGEVSGNSSMAQKRVLGINEYVSIRRSFKEMYGKDIEFLTLLGAFPQITDVEDKKKLVKLNIPKI